MVDFIGAARDPQFRQDVGQGLVDAFGRGLAMVGGAPVDLTTMFLRPLGYSVPDEQIVGSSEYIGRQMANLGLISETRNPAAEFLSALLIPDPTDIQKLAPYVQRAMNADLVAARPSTPGAAMPQSQTGAFGGPVKRSYAPVGKQKQNIIDQMDLILFGESSKRDVGYQKAKIFDNGNMTNATTGSRYYRIPDKNGEIIEFRISDHEKTGRQLSSEDMASDYETMIERVSPEKLEQLRPLLKKLESIDALSKERGQIAAKTRSTQSEIAENEAFDFLGTSAGENFLKENNFTNKDGSVKKNRHVMFANQMKKKFPKARKYELEKFYERLTEQDVPFESDGSQ